VKRFIALQRRIRREDTGQDIVEYVLMFGLVSIAALSAVLLAGPAIRALWTGIAGQLAALP
jgi:Flp pilus assembly pilin Flp